MGKGPKRRKRRRIVPKERWVNSSELMSFRDEQNLIPGTSICFPVVMQTIGERPHIVAWHSSSSHRIPRASRKAVGGIAKRLGDEKKVKIGRVHPESVARAMAAHLRELGGEGARIRVEMRPGDSTHRDPHAKRTYKATERALRKLHEQGVVHEVEILPLGEGENGVLVTRIYEDGEIESG